MEGVDVSSLNGALQFLRYLIKWHSSPTGNALDCMPPSKADAHRSCISQLLRIQPHHRSSRLSLVGDLMWLRDSWHDWLGTSFANAIARDAGNFVMNVEVPLVDPAEFRHSFLSWLPPDKVRYEAPSSILDSLLNSLSPKSQCAASLANNHAADRGPNSLFDTANVMASLGIACTGAPSCGYSVASFTCSNGARVCIVGAGWGTNFLGEGKAAGMACLGSLASVSRRFGDDASLADAIDISELENGLAQAREQEECSLAVASVHWGHEFELYPTEVQRALARRIVQLGFDIVLGHHSHVTQPAEVLCVNGYKGESASEKEALQELPNDANILCSSRPEARKALVLYSLGNFASTMYGYQQRAATMLTLLIGEEKGEWGIDALHFGYNRCSFWFGSLPVIGRKRELVLAAVRSRQGEHEQSKADAQEEWVNLSKVEREAVEVSEHQLVAR